MKTEILFGVHPILEALKAGRRKFFEIYVTRDDTSKRFSEIADAAKSYMIPIRKIPLPQLKSIANTEAHQGIGAKVSPYPLSDISEMTSQSGEGNGSLFFLILDNIVDTQNLGALIRTSSCVGVTGIIIPKDRAASPSPGVSKTSAGALEHVRLAQVTNLVNSMEELKQAGVWIAGTDRAAKQSVFDSDLTGAFAVVIGGEEKGIRPLVRKHCDFLISVPQKGPVDSLNASVAGAVVMYEVFRQRRGV